MKTSQAPSTLRVGVIGLGMGRQHVNAYKQCPLTQVVALCELNQALLADVASSLPGPVSQYTDPAQMFAEAQLDAVSIATPNALHHPLTLAAVQAGIHVLCEKPMAMNAREAREMVDAAAQHQRLLAIHYNHRMNPAIQWISRAAHAGELGRIYHARTHWHRRRGIPARASFLDKRNAGGGCLIDLGVHMLDQTLYIMGYPKVVSVSATTHMMFDKKDAPDLPMDVDDFATAYLRFADGASLSMEISWASHHNHPEQQLVQIYGTEGGARRLTENNVSTADIHRREHGALVSTRMEDPPLDLYTVQHDFARAILDNRPPMCSGDQGRMGMEILDAIYASAAQGCEIVLD